MTAPRRIRPRIMASAVCAVASVVIGAKLLVDARTKTIPILLSRRDSSAQEVFTYFADAVASGDLEAGLAFCTLDGVESVHQLGVWMLSEADGPKLNEWNTLKATQAAVTELRTQLERNGIEWSQLSEDAALLSTGDHGFLVLLVRHDGQWRVDHIGWDGAL